MRLTRTQGISLLAIGGGVAVLAMLWTRAYAPTPHPRVVLTSAEQDWLVEHGPLRFAPDPNFPPIEFFDSTGVYRGIVADYFRLIEQRLGAKIEIVRYGTWDEVLVAARSGEIDGVTAAQITPNRELYLDYTAPILDIPNVIIMRTGSPRELSLGDLDGKRVVVTQGNALDEHIGRTFPGIQLRTAPDDLACLREVSFGRADATVVNLAIASEIIGQHGIANLRVAGDSGRSNLLAIAVREDFPLLRGIMDKGLGAIGENERLAIRRRWIGLDIDSLGLGRTLTMLLVVAAAAMTLAAAVFLLWNTVLRRKVLAATELLRTELAERLRAEQALQASQRKLAAHLEQTLFFVIEWDTRGCIVDWNPAAAKVFGYTREEALGRRGSELVVPDESRAEIERVWSDLISGQGGRFHRATNRTKHDLRIACEWFNTTLVDENGRPTGAMSIGQDVSDRVRSTEALSQSQRLESLAVLAGGIAHDFNNLLAGILGNVALATSDSRLPGDLREVLDDAEAAAQRARGLTQQLLTFARGGLPVKRVIDLEPIVREAAHFATSGSNSICSIDADAAAWPVDADAYQIAQVVQNLVLNAGEAMPLGGQIDIELGNVRRNPADGTASAVGPCWRLRVADRGSGIDVAQLTRIFDPFFSTKERGSGLGLAVCHSIAVRHGGSIRALPRPGGGTVFEMLLPAQPDGKAEGTATAVPAPTPRVRVLVLDDEPALRTLAVRMFAHLGCEAETAGDGDETVRLFEEARRLGRPFDLVVLDLTIPGGTGGLDTLGRLRAIDPSVRAIVSSGYSTDPVMASHRKYGFAATLPKPYTPAELARALTSALHEKSPGGDSRS